MILLHLVFWILLWNVTNGIQQEAVSTLEWISDSDADSRIADIQVQCEKDMILVNVRFSKPFFGIIFSKGHYSDPLCRHYTPPKDGSGTISVIFEIHRDACGTRSSSSLNDLIGQPNPQGSFVENIIVIQYDPMVQEVFDQARKLRCSWFDFYEKSVSFRPFQVDAIQSVTTNFLGDDLQCWMQIQAGKGPYAAEVSGIVKIGQTMTMVIGIKDEEDKFDMMVRNCVAHDGVRKPVQLIDGDGCVIRKKIMGPFQKIRNFGEAASVVAYSHFQAFKFPDSMNVQFQCVVQVCRYNCPDLLCDNDLPTVSHDDINPFLRTNLQRRQLLSPRNRTRLIKRDLMMDADFNGNIELNGHLQVLSPRDILNDPKKVDFFTGQTTDAATDDTTYDDDDDDLCLSMLTFSSSIIPLLFVTASSSILTGITCAIMKRESQKPYA